MFKFYPQYDQMDCGPACLAMITSYYGMDYGLQYLRDNSFITRDGVSLLGISEASEKIGLQTFAVKIPKEKMKKEFLPAILHWNQNHFVVLYEISSNFFTGKKKFKIADPAHGFISLSEEKFRKSWYSENEEGVALLLKTTEEFYKKSPPEIEKISIKYLLK